jgi:hypothetical protein
MHLPQARPGKYLTQCRKQLVRGAGGCEEGCAQPRQIRRFLHTHLYMAKPLRGSRTSAIVTGEMTRPG